MAKWILNTKDINWLSGVANKYSKDFVPFYDFLNKYMKGHEPVLKARRNVKAVIKMINDLLKPTNIPTQKDLDVVIKSLEEVNQDFSYWLDESRKSQDLNRKLGEFTDKADISLDKLSSQQKVIQGRTEKIKLEKESLWSKFQDFSPELAAGVKGVGEYFASNLGTVGTLGAKAWGVGRGIVQGIKRRKLMAEHKGFAGAITPGRGDTPEGYAKILEMLTAGGKASFHDNTLGFLKEIMGGRRKRGTLDGLGNLFQGITGGVSGGVGTVDLGSGLFDFFNKSAGMLKTKWSKELFALLGKGESKKTIKEKANTYLLSGFLRGLATKILPIMLFAGTALGVAAAYSLLDLGIGKFLGERAQTDSRLAGMGLGVGAGIVDKLSSDLTKEDKQKLSTNVGKTGLIGGVSEFVTDRISSIFNKKSIEQVPLNVGTDHNSWLEKMVNPLNALLEEFKKNGAPKAGLVGMVGGYDAWNIRNPNLDNIVTANADLDQ